mgnify:CR=1 FL=1
MKVETKPIDKYDVVITLSQDEAKKLVYALGHVTVTDTIEIDTPLDDLYDKLKLIDGLL